MFEVLPKVARPATPSVPVFEEFTKVARPATPSVPVFEEFTSVVWLPPTIKLLCVVIIPVVGAILNPPEPPPDKHNPAAPSERITESPAKV